MLQGWLEVKELYNLALGSVQHSTLEGVAGTSIAGLISKKLSGLRVKPAYSAGMIGQSSLRVT